MTLLPAAHTGRDAMYCSQHVCMFVCLSAGTCQEPQLQNSLNLIFCACLLVVVAWSSSDDNAVRYVLPVLWMTSCVFIGDANRA